MNQVQQNRILFLLVFVAGLVSAPLLQAHSFPQPGNKGEVSLLGIYYEIDKMISPEDLKGKIRIHIDGPKAISMSLDRSEWGVLWFKVEPGRYNLVPSDNFSVTPGTPGSFEVPPSSVILAPFRIIRTEGGARSGILNEEERQRAGRELADHVDYPQWFGRDIIGFGTLRPVLDPETLQFTVSINSNSEASEVYVDDVLAGTAPLSFSLNGGKHRILIRAEGFEDAVYYVRLEGNAEINAELQPAATENQNITGRERYSTLVAPFLSMGAENDQLARLFADTLLLTLEEDERLSVAPSAVPWVQRDALIQPDFLPLEEVGADLVVSGFFTEDDGILNIQANLYDVQAETIRASVNWQGVAGFDIFDAMDEIAQDFAAEVDRVLPSAGRTLITRQETVFSAAGRNESLLARKKVIRKRWRDNPNVLTFQTGIGGLMEKFIVSDGTSTHDTGPSDGPVLPFIFSWDRDINSRFSAGAGVSFSLGSTRNDVTDSKNLMWSVSAFTGPKMVFRSLRADIYLGIDFQISYIPGQNVQWEDNGFHQADLSPLLYLELPMKMGFRYYFNRKIDTTPIFLNAALGISPLGYHFDLGGGEQNGMMSINILLNIGLGVRL